MFFSAQIWGAIAPRFVLRKFPFPFLGSLYLLGFDLETIEGS